MRPLLLLLTVAAFLVPASGSWAQGTPAVVIAPPYVKGALSDAITARIVNELEQAFTSQGWRVVGLSDAVQLAVTAPGACNHNACAIAYANAAQVGAALQLSLFANASGVTFSLALVQPPGDAFVHHGTLHDPSHPETVLAAAASDLLTQQARGPGPWLIVRGAPLDAAVRLDGEIIGVLPLRKRVAGGEHVLVVSAEGHADHNDTLWIDNTAGAMLDVQVDLKPAGAGALPVPDRRAHPGRTRDLIIGLSALALGGAVLTGGIVRSAEQCLERDQGRCVEQSKSWGIGAVAMTTAGATAMALGAAWLTWRVLLPHDYNIAPNVSHTEASLHLSREF